jgi:hypothetical protein
LNVDAPLDAGRDLGRMVAALKLQTSNLKLQGNSNFQAPNLKRETLRER